MSRSFRTQESYTAERTTRDMLVAFLQERGFTEIEDARKSFGQTQSQVLHATDESGRRVSMWVRLCWRREDDGGEISRSAAQLLSRINGDDWVGTLTAMIERERARGISHLLVVQRSGNAVVSAASIPLDSVVPIWVAQRDISKALIKSGALGRRSKNHAMNGSSPTIWLRDDKAPTVAEALWGRKGVRDLAKLPLTEAGIGASGDNDDSMDDLPGVNYASLGSDGAVRVQRISSGVKRDPRVRQAVFERSRGICERSGCGAQRDFTGFFDVHHILGAEKSDRVWNCVTLCPNCHREAHASPERDAINASLLEFARRFQ